MRDHLCRGYIVVKSLLLVALLSVALSSYAEEIKPFTSDGCSAFPDGTLQQQELWLDCCTQHDLAYWQGGIYEQRQVADQALKSCVAQVGEPYIAQLMLIGVRVGGSPYWPTQFRWGYGWSYPRGYKALSDVELEQVDRRSAEYFINK